MAAPDPPPDDRTKELGEGGAREVKMALAAARRMRRPMPLLREALRIAERCGPPAGAAGALLRPPDYGAVLVALMSRGAEPRTQRVRRPGSPLRAVHDRPDARSPGGDRLPVRPTAVAGLRLVRDPPPEAPPQRERPAAREEIGRARSALRRALLAQSSAVPKSAVAPPDSVNALPEPVSVAQANRDGARAGADATSSPAPAPAPWSGRGSIAHASPPSQPALDGDEPERHRPADRPGSALDDPEPGALPQPAGPRRDLRAWAPEPRAAHVFPPPPDAPGRPDDDGSDLDPGDAPAPSAATPATPMPGVAAAPRNGLPSPAAAPPPAVASPPRQPPAGPRMVAPPSPRPHPFALDDGVEALAEAAWRNGVEPA